MRKRMEASVSLITRLTCVACGRGVKPGEATTCPGCGSGAGILDVEIDLARAAESLTRAALRSRPRSLWRYGELLPLDRAFCPVDGAMGWTPLVEAPRLSAAIGVRRLRLKDDARSASGSFKDRASAVGVAHAQQLGHETVACASTGNAASSLACCAAAAGLACNIFVSLRVPEGKLAQLLAYGARVFKVRGTYTEAYDLCTQACAALGWYNRNAAINPYLIEGKKTGGLELAEQCDPRLRAGIGLNESAGGPPDWVACSVGDGCSIAAIWKGLRQMREIGLIDWAPRMLGVQAAGVAPVVAAWRDLQGRRERPAAPGDTYADSIHVPFPRNVRKALGAVAESGGAFVTVSDQEIREAVRVTGRLAGVFAEPAAGAAVAGVAAARRAGLIEAEADVVACITGNGLKDVAGALSAVGAPYELDPRLEDLQRLIG